jgi:argininosuccinate lyase
VKDNILHKGRLGSFSEDASRYTSSIDIDDRLLPAVIKINTAHTVMLAEQGVLDQKIAKEILAALSQVPANLEMRDDLEDIHMNVENFTISKIGVEAGGMMNLGKSRNDQVATALRMVSREQLITIGNTIVLLEKALLDQAARHSKDVSPGYTHLQRGQPITLGHYLLAHFGSLDRNFARLVDCYLRTDLSPMGTGALASSGININRERTAELLGFPTLLENSLDAVSSRDFATETIYLCAQIMTDLSRLAEELILWTTQEFGFAEISDEFSSTSSMMPQKKNAIVPEIFRARTSQIIADVVGAMGIVKALPLSYNLDLQELTRNLWSATDKATSSIAILAMVIREIKFNNKKIGEAVTSDEFLYATELADYLVQKYRVPFREAHSRVGRLVRHSVQKGLTRTQFTGLDLDKVNEILGITLSSQELASIVDPVVVLSKRKATGSPNPKMVLRACKAGQKAVAKHDVTLSSFRAAIEGSDEMLKAAAEKIQGRTRDADAMKRKLESRMEVKK